MAESVASTSDIGKVFGERVKAYRRALRLKQEAVGHAVGASKSWISEIESGKHAPQLAKAVALANFFGVPVDALVNEAYGEGLSPWLVAMRRLVLALPAEHRHTVAAMLEVLVEELKSASPVCPVVPRLCQGSFAPPPSLSRAAALL